MRKKRRRKHHKKRHYRKRYRLKISGIIIIVVFLAIIAGGTYFGITKYQAKKEKARQVTLKKDIQKHYHEFVITNKETKLYDNKHKEIGKLGQGVELTLEDFDITYETIYFKIKDFEDTYVNYLDVDKVDKLTEYDKRYQKYIPFNNNVKTNDKVSFYDENGNLVYTLNGSMDLPIIIKDDDKYGVEFKDRLLYIRKDDIKETYEHKNTDKHNSNGVAVLNYHFVYDENDNKESSQCYEEICISKAQFKRELDYFNENNIWPIKMHELELYMDKKLQLPKSVLITFDDGGWTKHAVDLLGEYKMYATFFLVTSWYNPKDYYKNEYIEFHSHTHNMHDGGKCPGGQGGAIKCLDKDKILDDLKKTREVLNGSTAFCYPFYEYNSYSEELLKEAGFTMAFIGEVRASYGPYKLAEPGGDKMKIPRFVVVNYTTIAELNRCFNEIK